MLAEQVIDFTRGDISSWGFWVLMPAWALCTLLKRKDVLIDFRRALKAILARVVIGLVLAALISGFIAVWRRSGPQYFTELRLQEQSVALKFRRATAVTEIPFHDITSVSVVDSGTANHPCSRVQIEASSGYFLSFGFNRLDGDQRAVLDSLRQRVATNSVPILH